MDLSPGLCINIQTLFIHTPSWLIQLSALIQVIYAAEALYKITNIIYVPSASWKLTSWNYKM